MKQITRALAFVLALLPALAAAQTFPTIPSQTVIGRTAFGPGPAQAIPFAQLSAQFCSNFTLTLKGCVPPPGPTTGRYLSDDIAVPWKALPTQQVVAGAGVTLNGTCAGNAINCTVNATAATQYVLPSRAAAAASDLSALSSIQTLGYATPGDGGGAVFKNVGTSPFIDSHVTSGAISAAGTGYTNGTYRYVFFSGGTGYNFIATVVVSGTVVTAVSCIEGCGQAFTAGDVLTAANTQIGGTGSGFTYTVSTVAAPKASFTDGAGNHWQYVVDAGNFINARQFGVKADFAGVDATATDDTLSIQAALRFARFTVYARQDLGGTFSSTTVVMPGGSALFCDTLTVYGAVQLRGQGPMNSALKGCDSGIPAANNVIRLGDPSAEVACFGVQIADINIVVNAAAAANAGTYILFSNCAQQFKAISNVSVYAGKRGCLRYEVGFGGAANFDVYDFLCTMNPAGVTAEAIYVGGGTTLFSFINTIIEGTFTGVGYNIQGGQVTIKGFHSEGIGNPIVVNQTVATHSTTVMHATGGGGCNDLITLTVTNTIGNFAMYDIVKQGVCTNVVKNNQPAGSNRAADARPKDGLVFFNP